MSNIKEKVITSRVLSSLLVKVLRMQYRSVYHEILSHRTDDILDYKAFVKALPKCFQDPIPDNNYWGIGKALEEYTGLKKIDAWIEHGYFWGSYVQQMEIDCYVPKIITFSKKKEEDIKKRCNKTVVPIGPYIHYVNGVYDEKRLSEEKAKLGKTLLFIPMHAGTGIKLQYDIEEINERISGMKFDYDTKVVCLFWTDAVNPDVVAAYEKYGFKIFCAGHRYDPNFLARQKTMFQMSDVIVTNGAGTHIGYAAYLKKPIWVIKQKVEETALNKKGVANMNIYNSEEERLSHEEMEFIENLYVDYSGELTKEQIEKTGILFGFDCIRSREELRNLLTR